MCSSDLPFLNLYHIDAVDTAGKDFNYYFASRNKENDIKIKTHDIKPEGIVIYGVKLEDETKLVLIRQYRDPRDAYIYELPAGLVDGDETPAQAAVREIDVYKRQLYAPGRWGRPHLPPGHFFLGLLQVVPLVCLTTSGRCV